MNILEKNISIIPANKLRTIQIITPQHLEEGEGIFH